MAEPGPTLQPRRRLRPGLVLPEGLEAGLIGGLAVVAIFTIHDVTLGEPIYTPALLGTLLFSGPEAARNQPPTPGVAAAYHAIHFTLWVLLGFGASALAEWVEERAFPRQLAGAAVLGSLLVLVLLDGWATRSGIGRLHLWAGGLAGLFAMAVFLAWRHPALLRRTAAGSD